ncbi:MAG: hypothetical protein QME76_04345 [Bacillota bacterium]|nr:hypothetical protein [Bacillota bacterium]
MQHRVLLQLAGFLAFVGLLLAANHLGSSIAASTRYEYKPLESRVLYILPYLLIVLGTLLLRLDKLWQAILLRRIRIRLSSVVIYGWPFALFVILLPMLYRISSNETAAILLMIHWQWFGSNAEIIESILFGIGLTAGLEVKGDTSSAQ